jgi:plasmid maintenance system antidote protein VapI
MRAANINFENLRAEMARKNLGVSSLSESLGINRNTMSSKLSRKSPLSLDEAFAIKRIFFPDSELNYLFKEVFETT